MAHHRVQSVEESLISEPRVSQSTVKPRLQCLDVFRGLTMAGMIMINNQGDLNEAIWPLRETEWNGLTQFLIDNGRTADMVFPAFLFINGMSIFFGIKPDSPDKKDVWLKLLKRVAILFLLGFVLNLQDNNFNFLTVRFWGVLQRTALCYFIVAIIRLHVKSDIYQYALASIFPLLYLTLMLGVYIPDCGKGSLEADCNTCEYVDRKTIGESHMYLPTDPEGSLVTTTNSIVNIFLGYIFMGIFQRNKLDGKVLLTEWSFLSSFLLVSGVLVHFWMPFNKKLWTLSFALFTSGTAGVTLIVCYIVVDYYQTQISQVMKWPFIWLGMNPLFVYLAMMFIEALFCNNIQFNNTNLWSWIYETCFQTWISPAPLSSLIFAFIHLVIWVLVARFMYRNDIFLKI